MKETDIERLILDWLDSLPNSFPVKINVSGKPIKIGGVTKLIPFGSKYSRKGVSDILTCIDGKFYAFEVKTLTEFNYITKHIDRLLTMPLYQLNSKQEHVVHQYLFLQEVNRAKGVGRFVCNLKQVQGLVIGGNSEES